MSANKAHASVWKHFTGMAHSHEALQLNRFCGFQNSNNT